MHSPEFVDTLADYIAIFVLVFVPALLIYLFWMVHILPEKIAERRGHPQADAIKTLCLLSLVFGGLLWPIAWLWAYSKPVLYKMAYGTDRVDHGPVAGDAHALVAPPGADLATVGSGHGAAALRETNLPSLGTLPVER
jgi:Protein of unknown function (DUF3302)